MVVLIISPVDTYRTYCFLYLIYSVLTKFILCIVFCMMSLFHASYVRYIPVRCEHNITQTTAQIIITTTTTKLLPLEFPSNKAALFLEGGITNMSSTTCLPASTVIAQHTGTHGCLLFAITSSGMSIMPRGRCGKLPP